VRVPVWRNDTSMTLSILTDSPRSFRGPQFTAALLQANGSPRRALEAYRRAFAIYDRDPRSLFGAADAALTLGDSALADSLLGEAVPLCGSCRGPYLSQAAVALARGDSAVAQSLLVRGPRP
jgi:Flp pilus assembly protein TadD